MEVKNNLRQHSSPCDAYLRTDCIAESKKGIYVCKKRFATAYSHVTPTSALTTFEKEGYVRYKNMLPQIVFISHISLLPLSSIST